MGEPGTVMLLVPQLGGADGVSELGRQVTRALAAGPSAPRVTVHSLDEAVAPPVLDGLPVRFVGSGGHRGHFVARVLASRPGALVFSLHLQLLPAALPLVALGARLGAWLHGIEAWAPLTLPQRLALGRARLISGSAHTIGRFRSANPSMARCEAIVCPPSAPVLAAPAEPDLEPGYALIVGRMSAGERYKGHDSLVDAWPRVRDAVPDARLVVAGDGDDRARLESLATARGVGDSVIFRGRVSAGRLAALYRDAACLVMPSRDEGFGLVYLEAMQAGRPCIVSPGAPTEIVEDGRTGLVVPYDDASALAAACVRLLSDADARTRMGEAARDAVARRFAFPAFARRLREALSLPLE